jgi:ATP-binding cassette subfamily F protein 3
MEVILTVEHLRRHFSAEPVLLDVTFQLRAGDKVGLVGPNGCGKTTLLNILAQREESEKGSIDKASDITIGYLEQRPDNTSQRTIIEEAKHALAPLIEMQREAERLAEKLAQTTNAAELIKLAQRYDHIHESLLRHDAYQLDHRIEKIMHGVGFLDDEFDKPVAALSGGELNRLSLAKLLLEEPDIMLLDEPSNHLDLMATEWLENFLHETSAAVLLVSHDRYFLDRVTNRTLELLHGTIDDYPGNFTKYTGLKEERLTVQIRTYEKFVEEVEKAKEFIRRNHYGMKAAQAEDRRKKLEKLQETPADLPRRITTPPMIFPKPSRTGDMVFRCVGLTKGYVPGKPLFRDLTFDIERGQRWAILGPNGCGKTTLLRCLLQQLQPDTGRVEQGQGLNIG